MSSLLDGEAGMTASNQSRQNQKVVTEFLQSEKERALNIHKGLTHVYGANAVDCSTVTRWVKRINDGQEEPGESDLHDVARSGRPASAYNAVSIDQKTLNTENRRVTNNELAEPLRVSAWSAVKIVDSMGIQKYT